MKFFKKALALLLTVAMVCSCGAIAMAATGGRDVSQTFKVTDPNGTVTTGTIFFQRGESFTIGYTWGKDPNNKTKDCWVLTINGVPVSTRYGRYTFCRVNGVDVANAATASINNATILYEGSYTSGTGPSVIYATQGCLPNRTLSYSGYSGNLWNGIQFSKEQTPEPASYAVTYDANAGSDAVANMPASGSYKAGNTVAIPTAVPTRSGYTFQNWLDTASNITYAPGASFTMPERAVVLRAQWKNETPSTGWQRDKYETFTVIDPDGNELRETVFFSSKESFTIGYTWGTDPLNTTKQCWVLTVNGVPLSQNASGQYAFYRVNGVNLSNTSAYAGAPTEATISIEGSWTAGVGPCAVYAPQDSAPNRTIGYSNYTSTMGQGIQFPAAKKDYAVTFANGADSDTVTDMPTNATCTEGESFTIPSSEPARDGYTFTGWKSADGTVYKPGGSFTMPAAAVTLTAQWEKIPSVSVSGTVTLGAGPLENCPVTLKNTATNEALKAATGADGGYAFDNLEKGSYILYIAQTDGHYGCYTTIAVDGATTKDVVLESKTPAAPAVPTLTGTVTDASNNPVACAISLRNLDTDTPQTLRTDANGEFAAALPAGNYRLYIGAVNGNKAYSETFVSPEGGSAALDIQLKSNS